MYSLFFVFSNDIIIDYIMWVWFVGVTTLGRIVAYVLEASLEKLAPIQLTLDLWRFVAVEVS